MKNYFIHFLAILFCFQVNAQTNIDLAMGLGKNSASTALSVKKDYNIGAKSKFHIGYGLRFTGFFANSEQLNYRTAPAKLTSGKASLVALFSEDIIGQIDTLKINYSQVNTVNLMINLGYNLNSKLSLGFNIDALGLSFGKRTNTTFEARVSDSQGNTNNGKTFSAKPTTFNLLLVSDSDIGSLNSEIFAKYKLNKKLALRAGGTFQFYEYTADKNLAFNNDRFRSKLLMPFIAFQYNLK